MKGCFYVCFLTIFNRIIKFRQFKKKTLRLNNLKLYGTHATLFDINILKIEMSAIVPSNRTTTNIHVWALKLVTTYMDILFLQVLLLIHIIKIMIYNNNNLRILETRL